MIRQEYAAMIRVNHYEIRDQMLWRLIRSLDTKQGTAGIDPREGVVNMITLDLVKRGRLWTGNQTCNLLQYSCSKLWHRSSAG